MAKVLLFYTWCRIWLIDSNNDLPDGPIALTLLTVKD